jgi:hypothetical protein
MTASDTAHSVCNVTWGRGLDRGQAKPRQASLMKASAVGDAGPRCEGHDDVTPTGARCSTPAEPEQACRERKLSGKIRPQHPFHTQDTRVDKNLANTIS